MCLEAAHNRIKAGLDTTSVEVLHSYLTERYQRKKIEWDNAEVSNPQRKRRKAVLVWWSLFCTERVVVP